MIDLSDDANRPEARECRPLRILLVDDEPLVREVLDACLAVDGHSIKSVCDAEEALSQIRSAPWDIVFTDRMMPGRSGEELAAEIKRFDPQIPVVLVTGMFETAEQMNAADVIDVLLRKPFTRQTLRDSITSAMNVCSHRREMSLGSAESKAA